VYRKVNNSSRKYVTKANLAYNRKVELNFSRCWKLNRKQSNKNRRLRQIQYKYKYVIEIIRYKPEYDEIYSYPDFHNALCMYVTKHNYFLIEGWIVERKK
jgi:hypothetical protein